MNTFHLLCVHERLCLCFCYRISRPLYAHAHFSCYGRDYILCHPRVYVSVLSSQIYFHVNNFHLVRVCARFCDHVKFLNLLCVHAYDHENIFHLLCDRACVHACDRARDRVCVHACVRACVRACDRVNTFHHLSFHACVL